MHNGGAYGDWTTESGAGFGYRASRTTGKLSELTFSSGGTGDQRGIILVQVVWLVAGVMLIAVALWHVVDRSRDHDVQFPPGYQAVLLTNGAVYFGHLQGYGGRQPVLTDVFYVATQTNSDTKQSSNVLIKRGKELHEPDRMYLNPQQILFVEPVGANSKVAQLIAQAK